MGRGGSYLSVEMQLYSTAPAGWARWKVKDNIIVNNNQ